MIQTEIEKKAIKNFAKFLIDNYHLDELEFSSTELLEAVVKFSHPDNLSNVLYNDESFNEAFLKYKKARVESIKRYNSILSSLRWGLNQMPADKLGGSNEEKSLAIIIKHNLKSAISVINELRVFVDFCEIEIIHIIDRLIDFALVKEAIDSKIEPKDLKSLASKLGVDAFISIAGDEK